MTGRQTRMRALRHLPCQVPSPEEADRIVARIAQEVPELARGRLVEQLTAGDVAGQVATLLVDPLPFSSLAMLAWIFLVAIALPLSIAVSVPIILVVCLVLALFGAFAKVGVVVAAWLGVSAVASLFVRQARWGCLPRRHAGLVEAFVDGGAPESAWVHYRAVRGIALDSETNLAVWVSALRQIAGARQLNAERRAELRHDCALIEAFGDRISRDRARDAARRREKEIKPWRR